MINNQLLTDSTWSGLRTTPGHLLTGTTACNGSLQAPGSAFRSHCRPTRANTSPRTLVPLRGLAHSSQWPETLGLAAIGSAALVESFADIARQEYLAVGLRLALHPQIDLATEPRWSRISGGFGEYGREQAYPGTVAVEMILNAGCDQLGGEARPELVVQLVEQGRVTKERIDVSVRRLLRKSSYSGCSTIRTLILIMRPPPLARPSLSPLERMPSVGHPHC